MIPGELIALLTFPGVIVHEFAHMLFCRLRGLAVLDVCFFRYGHPAGYVIHEESESFTTTFLVSVGPLFVNSLLCVLICLPAYLPMEVFGVEHPLNYALLWLGISIGMHAFPSNQDVAVLWAQAIASASRHVLGLLIFPFVLLIRFANLMSIVWFDLFYGFALGIGVPKLIL